MALKIGPAMDPLGLWRVGGGGLCWRRTQSRASCAQTLTVLLTREGKQMETTTLPALPEERLEHAEDVPDVESELPRGTICHRTLGLAKSILP